VNAPESRRSAAELPVHSWPRGTAHASCALVRVSATRCQKNLVAIRGDCRILLEAGKATALI